MANGPRRPRRKSDPAAPAANAATLSISLIGAVYVSANGKEIDLKLRKAAAVLGYLCLQERMAASRERLAYLLWSESEEQKARASLRQILATLRREFVAIGFNGLATGKLIVQLAARRTEVDLLRILDAADRMKVDPALLSVQRLPERILEGLEDLDDGFRSWLLPTRQAIHNRLERSLNAGLIAASRTETEKFSIATALIGLDPTNEQACRYILATYGRWGDVASAVRAYGHLAERLARDHSIKPSVHTQRLIDQIQRGAFKTTEVAIPEIATSRAPPLVGEVLSGPLAAELIHRESDSPPIGGSIAVYLDQFEIHGVASDRAYLVTGFRHELVACLVSFREWTVIESRAAMSASSPLSIAAEYRLEGTAYQADQTINMVLTLLDVARAAYVWSESFELRLDNWFTAQQRLIRRLAATLNVHVSAERLRRILSQPEVAFTTYDNWLRAQSLVATFRAEDWRKGLKILRQAKRASPAFSPLYSASAQMGNIESVVFPGILTTSARVEQNIAEAKRAVQLDPLDSRAHLCLSWAYALRRDFDAATPHMRHARELNDNDPWTTFSAGLLWAYAGDMDCARGLLVEASQEAIILGPKEWAYCAHIRFLSGDYDGAIEALDKAGDFPKTIAAWKAAAMAQLGRTGEAIDIGRDFLRAVRANWYGASPATDGAIGRWLLQAHPVGQVESWRRLRDGLKRAAIPVEGVERE
jgi:DNA-binding SARP family transcriptional activator/TolB-like protein